MRCGVDEVGEAMGRIGREAGQRFEGYTEPAETEKKILRDVFAPGDAWMRTGDLMRRDREGFYYFVDRVGDTFRWKGENVATSEVAAALGRAPGVREAVVYGVAVADADGKAGMAALTIDGAPDLEAIARARRAPCPAMRGRCSCASRPRSRRPPPSSRSGARLSRKASTPARVADPLYVYDAEREAYVALDAARFAAIASGDARL